MQRDSFSCSPFYLSTFCYQCFPRHLLVIKCCPGILVAILYFAPALWASNAYSIKVRYTLLTPLFCSLWPETPLLLRRYKCHTTYPRLDQSPTNQFFLRMNSNILQLHARCFNAMMPDVPTKPGNYFHVGQGHNGKSYS